MGRISEIAAQLDEVKEEMCDNYCRYPAIYFMEYEDPEEGHEAMLYEQCEECPLNNLTIGEKK